jgi:hypothetical protein
MISDLPIVDCAMDMSDHIGTCMSARMVFPTDRVTNVHGPAVVRRYVPLSQGVSRLPLVRSMAMADSEGSSDDDDTRRLGWASSSSRSPARLQQGQSLPMQQQLPQQSVVAGSSSAPQTVLAAPGLQQLALVAPLQPPLTAEELEEAAQDGYNVAYSPVYSNARLAAAREVYKQALGARGRAI